MPALLAILASLAWGTADFLGGALSRRMPTALVLLWSELAAVGCLLPVLLLGGWRSPDAYLWWGVGAGAFAIIGTAFFYRALAVGTMSVVAPIAGAGLIVPVLSGLMSGERPSLLALAGITLAAIGVVLASGPELRGEGVRRRSVVYAVAAACGFGGALTLVPRAGAGRWAMTTTVLMVTSLVLTLAYVHAVSLYAPVFRGTESIGVLTIGALNVVALSSYAAASTIGLVTVTSVLASLYPVVTVLLAQAALGERLRGVQLAGVAAAFVGVCCLAAG